MTFARALPLLFVTLPLLLTGGAGRAEAVYRCSGPGGTGTQYTQQPCPGGRAVDVEDARSDEQVRSARDSAARDAALAERLTREREQREARVRPTLAVAIRGERGTGGVRPAAASAPQKPSTDPGAKKKKKKAVKPKPLKQPA
jgi:hypothetical protein